MLIKLDNARAYQPFFDYLTGALAFTKKEICKKRELETSRIDEVPHLGLSVAL